MIENANANITDLNSIIISTEDKENKKSYINANTIPYQFAVYDDTTDSYYIVADENYLYIVYMSTADFYKLNTEDIETNPIRIEGITKVTTDDVKQLAIESYNELLSNEEDKLTIEDFNDYFGSVYLDMTSSDTQIAFIPFCIFVILLIIGLVILILSIIELFNFKKSINKMDDIEISDLDKELNDKESFYYDKANLYLTKSYIINFNLKFKIIKYEDILWMYPYEQRTNGIKTSQSIKVVTNDGKTHTIATIDIVTKKKKEIFTEIWNTIANKNKNMLLGYTKENIKIMKNKLKEIKKDK